MAERLIIKVPMPRASQLYFDACGMIDSHNCIRKMCGIEKRVRTHSWSTRVNLGILVMVFVDSFLLYKACCGKAAKYNPKEFFKVLAGKMLVFNIDSEGMKKTRAKRQRETERLQQLNKGVQHMTSRKRRKNSTYAKQGCCSICQSHTSLVCSRCSCLKKNEREVFMCKKHWKEHLERNHKH